MKKFLIKLVLIFVLISCFVWVFFNVPLIRNDMVHQSKQQEERKRIVIDDVFVGKIQIGGVYMKLTLFEFTKYSLKAYYQDLFE